MTEPTLERAASKLRVMAYCHDSVGIGHLRRTLAICERVGAMLPNACFLLATGTPYTQYFSNLPRVDFIKLPALAKATDGTYCSKYLTLSTEQLLRCRKSCLREVAEQYDPHVLLVDKAPAGVCRELLPTLRWLRLHRPQTKLIFGMRDIEDEAQATIRQWARDGVPQVLEECYDEIWVYGMREMYDVVTEYQLSAGVQKKLRFMGYVCPEVSNGQMPVGPAERQVLVTVGGGTDGELVLDTYLAQAAQRASANGVRSVIVGGPDLPPDAARRLRELAARTPGATWIDVETQMLQRMRPVELVVSMGGYNTMCELAALRKPGLVIPRTKPRLEQAIRAELWNRRGVVELLPPSELTPTTLADRVMSMLRRGRKRTCPNLDMTGLNEVAKRFEAFVYGEAHRAIAVRL